MSISLTYYVGFFDFESVHKKQEFECSKCEKIDDNDETVCHHKTMVKAVQVPITFSYLILDKDCNIVYMNTMTRPDAARRLLQQLIDIEPELLAVLNRYTKINMSSKDEEKFKQAVNCHICHQELDEQPVRDHCHITGKFLGAAHNLCNLQRSERKKIPMICHNLSGYDSHFLVQELGHVKGLKTLSALPYNTEKFRTIDVNSFQFKDSLSFLNASLDELMNDLLKNKDHKFSIIDQLGLYKKGETEKKALLLRKGVYPYEYATSIKKLKKTKKIPAKEHFFSSLRNSNISDEDYEHSKKVFKIMGCANLVDYTNIYCNLDVGILAEVFIQFRKLVKKNFGLDCCHYISTPQLAFDCMLLRTQVEIELLTDIDKILFIEQNIRGGVSYINTRHCKAEKSGGEEVQLKLIDANNLYGYAQMKPMPLQDFCWLEEQEFEKLDWTEMSDEQTTGYILEVDLEYPKKLHRSHNSFPLAPEQLQITDNMLSPYAKGEFLLSVGFEPTKTNS